MPTNEDISFFYYLCDILETKNGGSLCLSECDGKMNWPSRGVYFFFDNEELHKGSNKPKIVRIGTHGLIKNSKTTLWQRLCQHRGTVDPYGGNHKSSIFRLLTGEALYNRNKDLIVNGWGKNSNRSDPKEQVLERLVSDYIGKLKLLVVNIPDEPSSASIRGTVERNSIALLSSYKNKNSCQNKNDTWLGNFSQRELVRKSGLWNSNHVNEDYFPEFLQDFEKFINLTDRIS